MSDLETHPTVRKLRAREPAAMGSGVLEAAWLRDVALAAGADDVGFVSVHREEIAEQRPDILRVMPSAKTLVSLVCRMNRGNIRSPQRSLANLEFHQVGHKVDDVCHAIARACEERGVNAINVTMGFPMEAANWPGRIWVVSHKPVAIAAGLGQMGIHRNVIHPRFGNFILLGTVILGAEVSEESRALDYNPCLTCKLCVAACPTGAIGSDGQFDFAACYTHNYREFMGGFSDWVETIASSGGAKDYRARVSDSETVSLWQSLSFGANYKAAYCLAVCPAGEEVALPFLGDRKSYLREVVTPLQKKEETVFVVPDSDAESYVRRRFPEKTIKRVGNGLRPGSIKGFLDGIRWTFQRGMAKGLNARYHFTFTGREEAKATVIIERETLRVEQGHAGKPDLSVTADAETWLGFLRKEKNLVWAFLRGKVRLKGSPRLLLAFGRCFPS